MIEAQTEGAIPLRERRSLADEWRDFERRILPQGAGPIQLLETRRAFYAGAQTMFNLITDGLDADSGPTDLDVAYVESLFQEMQQFARDIQGGKA